MKRLMAGVIAVCLWGQDWPHYAGDAASTHYSALTGIDRANVARMKPVWEWK